MTNNQFTTPLLHSAVIVVLAVLLVVGLGAPGGILALLSGIGTAFLFVFGMVLALGVSIAVLVSVFLAAVAMVDSTKAASFYSSLKKSCTCICS